MTYREDACELRSGTAPRITVSLRNLAIGLARLVGPTSPRPPTTTAATLPTAFSYSVSQRENAWPGGRCACMMVGFTLRKWRTRRRKAATFPPRIESPAESKLHHRDFGGAQLSSVVAFLEQDCHGQVYAMSTQAQSKLRYMELCTTESQLSNKKAYYWI